MCDSRICTPFFSRGRHKCLLARHVFGFGAERASEAKPMLCERCPHRAVFSKRRTPRCTFCVIKCVSSLLCAAEARSPRGCPCPRSRLSCCFLARVTAAPSRNERATNVRPKNMQFAATYQGLYLFIHKQVFFLRSLTTEQC